MYTISDTYPRKFSNLISIKQKLF